MATQPRLAFRKDRGGNWGGVRKWQGFHLQAFGEPRVEGIGALKLSMETVLPEPVLCPDTLETTNREVRANKVHGRLLILNQLS
jgi:hypothetical protein